MTTGPVEPLAQPPAGTPDPLPEARPEAPPSAERAPMAPADRDSKQVSARWSVALGGLAVVVPALTWLLMPDLISGDTASALVMLNMLVAVGALGGLVLGIVARREGLGVLGILLSLLGGAVSSGTMLLLALGAALAGMNAGL